MNIKEYLNVEVKKKNRVRIVRETRYLNQTVVADEIGVTQQMLSKYEKDIKAIKVDVLK
jgi:DNA-binding XRE family transcriptional regulator